MRTLVVPRPTEAGRWWTPHAALLGAGLAFGSTFVVVRDAVDTVEVVPFLAVRFLIGAAALLAIRPRAPVEAGRGRAAGWCGLSLLAGYLLQTAGLQYTTTSVSAFATCLLVVLVPLLSAAVLRRPPTRPALVGVAVATVGLFLLTGGGAGLGRGELLTLGCAAAFAIHVVMVAAWASRFDTVRFTALQLLVVGAACLGPGLVTGGYGFSRSAWLAAAYTGVAVSAAGFGLQVWGQRRVDPTRASLLLMMEPVSAAVVGWAVGERLGLTGVAGAVLILAGIAVAELPVARSAVGVDR